MAKPFDDSAINITFQRPTFGGLPTSFFVYYRPRGKYRVSVKKYPLTYIFNYPLTYISLIKQCVFTGEMYVKGYFFTDTQYSIFVIVYIKT